MQGLSRLVYALSILSVDATEDKDNTFLNFLCGYQKDSSCNFYKCNFNFTDIYF